MCAAGVCFIRIFHMHGSLLYCIEMILYVSTVYFTVVKQCQKVYVIMVDQKQKRLHLLKC